MTGIAQSLQEGNAPISEKPLSLNEAMAALVGVAANVVLKVGQKYNREHPDSFDAVARALQTGAPLEARVRLSPSPGVDIIVTLDGEPTTIATGTFQKAAPVN